MNKVRRALLFSLPMGALVGLSGCKIGSSGDALSSAAQAGEQALANGRALKVSPVWPYAVVDATFAGDGQAYFIPDENLLQGCINGDNLYLSLWQGSGNQQRAIVMILLGLPRNPASIIDPDAEEPAEIPEGTPYYLDTKTFDFGAGTAVEGLVVVNVFQNDGTQLHDFTLSEGTVTITGLSSLDEAEGGEVVLTFSGVKGAATTSFAWSGNEALYPLQLDGQVRFGIRQEDVSWLA